MGKKLFGGKKVEVVVEDKEKGVLYRSYVNGKSGWYKNRINKEDSKYVGGVKNGLPHGSVSIFDENGEADCFISNHTFSNIIDLDDFVKGVKQLLASHGIFSMQTHYHLDVIEKNLVENFTHEHLSGFYVKPLVSCFAQYGLELFHVQRVPAKEGSIRCFIQHENGPNEINSSVADIISYEESIRMDKMDRHDSITGFITEIKSKLHNLLDAEITQGKTVAAFGTSTGATTFSFNYDLGNIISFFVLPQVESHNLKVFFFLLFHVVREDNCEY